jgi:outer membrane receptor for ferrienterochelin and colicins
MFLLFLFALCCTAFSVKAQNLDSIAFSIEELDDIVITGQYEPTNLKNTLLPIRIISKEMIQKRGATTLSEVFRQEAAIQVIQDPVLGSRIQLNGLSGKYVKILIDGVPVIGRLGGDIDLDRINVQNVERIEVIENAMSVAYGTNAMAGTINIITSKPSDYTIDGTISTQYESNTTKIGNTAFNLAWKGLAASFNYNYSAFDGMALDTLRSQDFNPKIQNSYDAKLSYLLPKSTFNFTYNFRLITEEIIDKGIEKLVIIPEMTYAKDYIFITEGADHSLSAKGYVDQSKKFYLEAFTAFNTFNREKNAWFVGLRENPVADSLDGLDSDTTFFSAWNARVTLASSAIKDLKLQLGVDLRSDFISGERIVTEGVDTTNNARLGDYAAFVTGDYTFLDAIRVNAGCRIAYNTLNKQLFTYSGGVKYQYRV